MAGRIQQKPNRTWLLRPPPVHRAGPGEPAARRFGRLDQRAGGQCALGRRVEKIPKGLDLLFESFGG